MNHEVFNSNHELQKQLVKLNNLVTIYVDENTARSRPRAMAPAEGTYPRAAVVRLQDGQWGISIKHSSEHWYGDHLLDEEGKALAFDLQRGALSHAAREIHALRARRHPAGQSWLRGKGAVR